MAAQTERGGSVMDPLKGFLLSYFMSESCYDEFFLNFNFLHGKTAKFDVFYRRYCVCVFRSSLK